jgi:hypothetical protein
MFVLPPSAAPDQSGWLISDFSAHASHNAPTSDCDQYLPCDLEISSE